MSQPLAITTCKLTWTFFFLMRYKQEDSQCRPTCISTMACLRRDTCRKHSDSPAESVDVQRNHNPHLTACCV